MGGGSLRAELAMFLVRRRKGGGALPRGFIRFSRCQFERVYLCVLASSVCSRMDGPGPSGGEKTPNTMTWPCAMGHGDVMIFFPRAGTFSFQAKPRCFL